MDSEIKKIMSSVFDLLEEEIDDNTTPDTVQKWDSLRHINLVLALEEEFSVSFSDEEIMQMVSFAVIRETLRNHLGQ